MWLRQEGLPSDGCGMKDGISFIFSASRTKTHVASTVERALDVQSPSLADARSNGKGISCRRPATLIRSSTPFSHINFDSPQTVIRQPPKGHATLAALLSDVTLKELLRPPLSESARTAHHVEFVTHATEEFRRRRLFDSFCVPPVYRSFKLSEVAPLLSGLGSKTGRFGGHSYCDIW